VSPFERLLGVEADADEVVLAPRHPLTNRGGRLHGGAIASLHAIAGERLAGGALAELMLLYVAPPADSVVRATASVIRRGGLVQADSTLTDAAGAVVSRALTLHRGSVESDDTEPSTDALPDASGAAVAEASPFAATLAIAVVQRERARGVAVLPWRDVLADGGGMLHPGALATLVDTASGAAVWNEAGLGDGGRAATVAMHLAVQRRVAGEDVVAEAHATAESADLVTATLRLWARRSRRLVATGSARYRVVRSA